MKPGFVQWRMGEQLVLQRPRFGDGLEDDAALAAFLAGVLRHLLGRGRLGLVLVSPRVCRHHICPRLRRGS